MIYSDLFFVVVVVVCLFVCLFVCAIGFLSIVKTQEPNESINH